MRLLGHLFKGDVFLGIDSGHGVTKIESTLAEQDHRFRAIPSVQSGVTEASHSKNACQYAAESGHSSGVLKNIREDLSCILVLGFGAESEQIKIGIVVGVSLSDEVQPKETYGQVITALQEELPRWVTQWQVSKAGRLSLKWQEYLRSYRSRKGRIATAVTACCLGALFIPMPHWPKRDCVIEPSARRFLSSPVEGRILESKVQPGDLVDRNQLLARMDDQQLLWDLSAAKAEYQSAMKRRETALVARAGGDIQIAQLDQQRIQTQIESIEQKLKQLEIHSPTSGVVIQGDWHRSEGAPVSRGDSLFEIASLDEMQVQIHLTTEDLSEIEVGDQVTIRIDSAYGECWEGKIARIDPRGQVIDSKVVFIAELEIANRDELLRPGMKGTVRISTGTRSLGSLLLRRPYVWLMKKLVW